MNAMWRSRTLGMAVVAAGSVAVAACGSSDSTSGSSVTTASAGANVSAAQAVVNKYSAGPTAFPVDQRLKKKLPAAAQIGYLQCGAPNCALLGQVLSGATKLMGNSLLSVKAENSTDSIQSAMSSLLAKKPGALLLAGVNTGALGDSLGKFGAANIPVGAAGLQATSAQGIDVSMNGPKNIKRVGTVLADWAIVNGGTKNEVVIYSIPELDFSAGLLAAFKAEFQKNCAGCKLREATIPIVAVGTTAPSRVVSDLQSHPDTKVAVFGAMDVAIGLPAALKTAGIDVKTSGFAPTPATLQDIKSGSITSGVGLDLPVLAYTLVDASARLATGQPLTADEKLGLAPIQLLDKETVPADPSKAWTGYPDFGDRFAKLWASAQS